MDAPKKQPKFTISVLTYCAVEHAKKCVDAILAEKRDDFELILTANGSDAAAGMFLRYEGGDHRVKTVVFGANQGFIEPNKHVASIARGEYLVLINDDCVPPTGWLDLLETPFRKWPSAAISGPKHNASIVMPNCHGQRSNGPLEYIEFSCAMIKMEVIRKHGLFIEGISFAYGEDASTCLEYRRLGYTLHLVPLTVKHAGQQTSKHVPAAKQSEIANHAVMKKRFNHYLTVTRRFDYPIRVRRWAAIGDILLLTPAIKTLAEQNPTAQIHVECAFPEIFRGNPHVTSAAHSIWQKPDTQFYNLDMAYENRPETHVVDAYAQALDLDVMPERKLEIYTNESEESKALNLLPNGGYVAIHMGPGTWVAKNWPMTRWDVLLAYIDGMGLTPVLLGKGNEEFPIGAPHIDLRNKLTIHETAAVIRYCKFTITIDSLPLHLSQAVGTPTIGLFGATRAKYLGTDGSQLIAVESPESHPLSGKRHKIAGAVDVKCTPEENPMLEITVDMVLSAVDKLDILCPK